MTEAPRVFISYSHDSQEHKDWVRDLGTKLRENGVDVTLDQWDLRFGDDVTRFMEDSVSQSSRVLMVCTPQYVRKADGGLGGVGYERTIVTAELVQNLGQNKFVPLIRVSAEGSRATPLFLGTRYYIDFQDDAKFKEKLEELLRELHQAPANVKPLLGKNPFALAPSGSEAPPIEAVAAPLPATVATGASDAYRKAVELARRGDTFGWRQLVKSLRPPAFQAVVDWRTEREKRGEPRDPAVMRSAVEEALAPLAPLFAVALAGVESGRQELRDQRAFLDEVLAMPGWSPTGLVVFTELPQTMAYVYQGLHGAVCTATNQLDVALDLVEVKRKVVYGGPHEPLWKIAKIIASPSWLELDPIKGWEFLKARENAWPWLIELFGTSQDYRIALTAYSLLLHTYELACTLAAGLGEALEEGRIRFDIPPMFLLEGSEVLSAAMRLLLRKTDQLRGVWERLPVPNQAVRKAWPAWMRASQSWHFQMTHHAYSEMPHAGLLDGLP